MFSIVSQGSKDLPDIAEFIEKVNSLQRKSEFFAAGEDVFISRAPGRLDLMGGIADYSGSLVLQYPIREATRAAVQKHCAPVIYVDSVSSDSEMIRSFEIPLEKLKKLDGSSLRAFFQNEPENHWAAYIIGVFAVLAEELNVNFSTGARIFISSDVPEGKGVSSSAALEVAAMQGIKTAFGLNLSARDLALLCQKTENEIVGAPCGVMDQMVSACGEENRLSRSFVNPPN